MKLEKAVKDMDAGVGGFLKSATGSGKSNYDKDSREMMDLLYFYLDRQPKDHDNNDIGVVDNNTDIEMIRLAFKDLQADDLKPGQTTVKVGPKKEQSAIDRALYLINMRATQVAFGSAKAIKKCRAGEEPQDDTAFFVCKDRDAKK